MNIDSTFGKEEISLSDETIPNSSPLEGERDTTLLNQEDYPRIEEMFNRVVSAPELIINLSPEGIIITDIEARYGVLTRIGENEGDTSKASINEDFFIAKVDLLRNLSKRRHEDEKRTVEVLREKHVEGTERFEQIITEMEEFYVKYFVEELNINLGVEEDKREDFVKRLVRRMAKARISSIVELHKENILTDKGEVAGSAQALAPYAFISNKIAEIGKEEAAKKLGCTEEEFVDFYASGAMGHEVSHGLWANVFLVDDKGREIHLLGGSNLTYILEDGIDYSVVDGKNTLDVSSDGFLMSHGQKTDYQVAGATFWIPKGKDKAEVRLDGNLLDEAPTILVESKVRRYFGEKYFPKLNELQEKRIDEFLAAHPEKWPYREGLYFSFGFPPEGLNARGGDRDLEIVASSYRKIFRVYKLLESVVNQKYSNGDPKYFERLFQEARMVNRHAQLWEKVTEVLGGDKDADLLVTRIRSCNQKNIDPILAEMESRFGDGRHM